MHKWTIKVDKSSGLVALLKVRIWHTQSGFLKTVKKKKEFQKAYQENPYIIFALSTEI